MQMMDTSDKTNLQAVMAGNGTPYAVLTPLRKQLLRALYDEMSLVQISFQFGMPIREIQAELAPLVEASLARDHDGRYAPTFFIADAEETRRVADHAAETGAVLAACLQEQWDDIEQVYRQLSISRSHTLIQTAFFLIGNLILDTGMLDTLARDATLMPGAPARPSPDSPDAHYYFWMVEGNADDLGHYGAQAIALPQAGWFLITFGRYHIDEKPNTARQGWTANAHDLLQKIPNIVPKILAERLNALLLDEADARRWADCVQAQTQRLLQFWHSQRAALNQLYGTLKAVRYAPYGSAEFFCWYNHLAFAAAIDMLAYAGDLLIPEAQFSAAVCYQVPVQNGWLSGQ
jgi:hypothetical protein